MEGGNFNFENNKKEKGQSREELIDELTLYEERLNKLVFNLREVIDEIKREGGNKKELEILKSELEETQNNIIKLNKYTAQLIQDAINDIE
jgi:hypothetical protein